MSARIVMATDQKEPIGVEIIEGSIVSIAASMKRIDATRLSRKALLILISKDTGLGTGAVNAVLNSLSDLERTYLKPKKGNK